MRWQAGKQPQPGIVARTATGRIVRQYRPRRLRPRRDDAPADGETASAGGGRWRIACDGDRAVRWRYRGDLEDQLATDGLGDAPAVVGNLDEGAGAADHVAAIMVVERHPGRAAHAAAGPPDHQPV